MKRFLKSNELQLINGGYLSAKDESPVTNAEFVDLQRRAEYIVTFADMAKGKNFNGTKADDLEAFRREVAQHLEGKKTEFVKTPKAPKRELSDKLKEEAMSFMDFETEKDKISKVNEYLQQFNLIKEFEDFGLFFDQGIVKLNKIYTVKEITNAVTSVINLL